MGGGLDKPQVSFKKSFNNEITNGWSDFYKSEMKFVNVKSIKNLPFESEIKLNN